MSMATRPEDDAPLLIHAALASSVPQGQPAAVGAPFPKGMLRDTDSLWVQSPDGEPCPLAARPLVQWPDGSVRWALLAFAPKQKGPHRVHVGTPATASSPAPAHPVVLSQSDGHAQLSNGLVSIDLAATGPGPIRHLKAAGHTFLADAEDFQLQVDDASTLHESQRTLRVLESSPLRCRVRVEGAHYTPGSPGTRRLNYRLDVELWANHPSVRLDYHFFNLEPGHDTLPIDRIAMDFRFALPEATRRHFLQRGHGLHTLNREVHNPAPVALVTDSSGTPPHVQDPAMLLDDTDYPFYLRPPRTATGDWLGIGAATSPGPGVYARMADFDKLRPNRLASEDDRLTLEVWPAAEGVMHLPQGRSRRQTLTFTFTDQSTLSVAALTAALAAPLHEGRASVDPAWLARCGAFDQDRVMAPGRNARFEKFVHRLMRLNMSQGMFDYGDTPDSHYQRTYAPIGYIERRADTPQPRPTFLADGRLADWQHTYEPVWTNNEYDVIHTFASELMRTGRPDLWPTLTSLARHNIEVDFVHYSDHRALHRATPAHSARHTTTGAYPSHYWTQGLLQYYCMTGDPDALDTAIALGDKIIENFTHPDTRAALWGFNRELGWPVLALSHLVDLTGEARFAKLLDELVDFLVSYDRKSATGAIKLSSGNALRSFPRQMIDGFFGFASMIEGVDHYLRHVDRPEVVQWFVQLLAELQTALDEAHREGAAVSPTAFHPQGMAIAYERTGDTHSLDLGMLCLQELMDLTMWQSPIPEVKPVAMVYRSYMRFFHHAQRLGWLDQLDYQRFGAD